MSAFDPKRTFQIIWKAHHIELVSIEAHRGRPIRQHFFRREHGTL
jgi:hypothetical protein